MPITHHQFTDTREIAYTHELNNLIVQTQMVLIMYRHA